MTSAEDQPARLVETHTAYVLLLGSQAIKWKKPVDLGFLDFRTVEARTAACQAEVDLNRRLAADVYDGCATVLGPDGNVVESAVVMRRLPDDRSLSARVTSGQDVLLELREVAQVLADFHAGCPRAPDGTAVAGPARLLELWRIGLGALRDAPPDVITAKELDRAEELVHLYLDRRAAVLRERIDSGRVRDGHGDLLADDVFLMDDGPRLLDCLEFDPSLRFGDVLGDVASLAADLERMGACVEAKELLATYTNASGDRHPASLAHLYLAYRSQVRAKVACVRAGQARDPSVRRSQLALARRLCGLMLQHLEQTRTRLVVVGGLPGSGKSTVAAALSKRTDARLVSSDQVRREIVLPACADPDLLYSSACVDAVYDALLARARSLLEAGESVVLDASWGSLRRRKLAVALAEESDSELTQLECSVDDDVADERLRTRPPGHVSDATPAIRSRLRQLADPWPDAVRLNTGGAAERTVQVALAALDDHEPAASPHRS